MLEVHALSSVVWLAPHHQPNSERQRGPENVSAGWYWWLPGNEFSGLIRNPKLTRGVISVDTLFPRMLPRSLITWGVLNNLTGQRNFVSAK